MHSMEDTLGRGRRFLSDLRGLTRLMSLIAIRGIGLTALIVRRSAIEEKNQIVRLFVLPVVQVPEFFSARSWLWLGPKTTIKSLSLEPIFILYFLVILHSGILYV